MTAHPLVTGSPPAWASEWGEDEFGVFVGFAVAEVVQRMRWIPPGRFSMGSPASEAGREEHEAAHEVELTQGFWLGDTPVTQELWEAVMGNNPSRFVSPCRPVESVRSEQAMAFCANVEQRVSGLALHLPTEAQWEYACRAETTTATYAGDLEIQGVNNAPVLDAIAWYGGNSGVNFDLDEGEASEAWPEKQYPHAKAGTRAVATKQPNAWGLFDTLGQVFEWCADWYDKYPPGPAVDPTGPARGRSRVIRGGSWYGFARNVRAACRGARSPGDRDHRLGFRCARGPE
ncbi:MAG: formylglycine-generating enzyme family protein [Planctomycetota bacterium]